MKQYTTGFSPNASLALLGQWTQDKGIWKKLKAGLHIHQKVIKHTPHEKLQDLLINIWAGGTGIADVNQRVRTDEAFQELFGRHTCAEQRGILFRTDESLQLA